jgi:hypothetical protein
LGDWVTDAISCALGHAVVISLPPVRQRH